MSLLADKIEQLILDKLLNHDEDIITLKRNELADELECAPSQISYVLSTRFSTDKGFNVISRRGLGGFIRIAKISQKINEQPEEDTSNHYLPMTIPNTVKKLEIDKDLPPNIHAVDNWLGMLLFREKINNREARILHSAFETIFTQVPDKAVNNALRFLYKAVLKEIRGE